MCCCRLAPEARGHSASGSPAACLSGGLSVPPVGILHITSVDSPCGGPKEKRSVYFLFVSVSIFLSFFFFFFFVCVDYIFFSFLFLVVDVCFDVGFCFVFFFGGGGVVDV